MATSEGKCTLLCSDFNSDLLVGNKLVTDCELLNALVGGKATFTSGSGDSALPRLSTTCSTEDWA
jgi:hypothetical protein